MGSVIAYLVTPLTARVARRLGVLDHPIVDGSHKTHALPTPYLGGVAIFCGLVGGGSLMLAVPALPLSIVAGAVAAGLVLGVIGLIDDIRHLPRVFRLAAQAGAAITAWALGFRVDLLGSDPGDFVITIVWIVGITNAFNLLDNMDGLSSGLAAIAATSFALMSLVEAQPALPILSAALAGASFGFLAHNRHPARVFMGDAGSTFLGFLLALIGIQLRFDNLVQVTFLVPVVVLGIPLLDTTLVVLSRLRHRRPVFLGARDHLSHRLVRAGLPVKAAVGILYFWAAALGWLGLVIARSTPEVGWMLLAFVVAVAVFFAALLWRVPVYVDEGIDLRMPADAVDPDEARPEVQEALKEEKARLEF